MNLYVHAEVKATVHTIPPKETVVQHTFELWQTPSHVTRSCMKANVVADAYIAWLKEQEPEDTCKVPVYSEEDNFCKGPIIDYVDEPTARAIHQKELEEWLEEHKDWKIIWEMM
jgi:hypothetical protein